MLCCVLPMRECICSGLHLSCSLLLCECPCVVSRVSCVVGGRLLFLNGCWPTFYHVVLANCNINKRQWPRHTIIPTAEESRSHAHLCFNAFYCLPRQPSFLKYTYLTANASLFLPESIRHLCCYSYEWHVNQNKSRLVFIFSPFLIQSLK